MSVPNPIPAVQLQLRISPAQPPRSLRTGWGFSLVEVVLALGICAFAMVAIVGMIPVGLATFRDAMDTSAQSQIVQRVASEILLADFNNLAAETLYYNEQGTRTEADADDLAYTIELVKQPSPVKVADSSGTTVKIRIARTFPGQTFEHVERTSPRRIYSYPVIVSNIQRNLDIHP